MKVHKFEPLDALRGVAALAVMALHAPVLFGPLSMPNSNLAVDLFFIMSGFVMTHAYESRLVTGLSVREFMILRVIRLYPLFLLGAIFGVLRVVAGLLIGATEDWTWSKLAIDFALMVAFVPSPPSRIPNLYPLNSPAWSLLFELVVNFVWALALPFCRSTRSVAIVVGVAAILFIASLAYCSLQGLDLNLGFIWATAWAGVIRVIFGFFVGVLMYKMRSRITLRLPTFAAVIIVLGLFYIHPAGFADVVYKWVSVVFLMPLVVVAVSNDTLKPAAAKICVALGLSSYAVYICHRPILRVAEQVVVAVFGANSEILAPWLGLLVAAAMFSTALLLDKIYDMPARAWLTKIFVRPRI